MKSTYDNFIGIYHNVYPEGYCQHLIDEFERLKNDGAGGNRKALEGTPAHIKDDYSIELNIKQLKIEPFFDMHVKDVFFKGLQECYNDYVDKFAVLTDGRIRGTAMKMQRTSSGGGYHVWHGEHGPDEHSSRVLVYSLYLNTLNPENCGETEFLYQQKRFNPVENTIIIWPAAFTHAHRGNPVYGDVVKYIVTGWFEFS